MLGFSTSSATVKTSTYEPIPLEEELAQKSSFETITVNRQLRLIEGYCKNSVRGAADIHRTILKYYLDKAALIFEGMYLDFQQLHSNSIIICPYLGSVSMNHWNDTSFAREHYNKMHRSLVAFRVSISIQLICIILFILLIILSVGILGDLSFAFLALWGPFILINIACWYYVWFKPYKTHLPNISHKYILLHFDKKKKVIEKWIIRPKQIGKQQYVMQLAKIEQIVTFEEVKQINYVPQSATDKGGAGWIRIVKNCNEKIWFLIPKGFGSIVKQRLREFILIYLTEDDSIV